MTKQVYFFIFILSVLFGCVEERDLTSNTVIAHILSQPDGLHPYNDNSVMRSYIFNYTQKFVVGIDLETLDYIPKLAESMAEISNNGFSYTYRLKDGVKWDNGDSFTAKDVEFSTKAMLCHLTNNAQIRSLYSTVIKSIELHEDDPLKFTMHTQGVHVNNKTIIGGITLQQKSYWDPNGVLDKISFEEIIAQKFNETEEISNWFNAFNHSDNGYQPERLRGLGPYQVDEWVASQYITLIKKKDWWGENDSSIYNKRYPDRIIFKIIKEDASSYLALKNQEIDVTTSIGTVKLMKLQERDYFNNSYDSDFLDRYAYNYIGLNMKPDGIKNKPFFVDQKVRRAMAYLIPADEIIEVMLHGKASRQAAQISSLKKTYNDTLKLIPLDIEKAKQLLTEAGWVDTDGDNIRDKIINDEKTPFIFKFSYMQSPITKEIVLMIKESLYKAGIFADPNPMDFTLFYKNAMDHKFDAMLGGWGGSASYSNPMQLWHTSSWVEKGSNFCGFGDAESDALIQEANISLDYEKHKDALWKLQAKIYKDQPYVFLWSSKRKFAIHKRFNNRNMYYERPGVMLNNLKLNTNN